MAKKTPSDDALKKKFDEMSRKLDLMETTITENLGTQLQALVDQAIPKVLDKVIKQYEKKRAAENKDESSHSVANKLDVLIAQNDYIKQEFAGMKTSLNFINAEFERHKNHLTDVDSSIKILQSETQSLHAQSSALAQSSFQRERENENLEQFLREENLEIHGVPSSHGENTDDFVLKIGKAIDIDIRISDISVSHRLPGGNTEKPAPILVRFISRRKRNEFMKNKRLIKDKDIASFNIEGLGNLFINENLTRFKRELLYEARKLKKLCKYEYLWTVNGNIYIKKDRLAQRIQINCKNDLAKIV